MENLPSPDVYAKELSKLKTWDSGFVGMAAKLRHSDARGCAFVLTSGHGYLAVPKSHALAYIAADVLEKSGFGFEGDLAYYLEEDCEAPAFEAELAERAAYVGR